MLRWWSWFWLLLPPIQPMREDEKEQMSVTEIQISRISNVSICWMWWRARVFLISLLAILNTWPIRFCTAEHFSCLFIHWRERKKVSITNTIYLLKVSYSAVSDCPWYHCVCWKVQMATIRFMSSVASCLSVPHVLLSILFSNALSI